MEPPELSLVLLGPTAEIDQALRDWGTDLGLIKKEAVPHDAGTTAVALESQLPMNEVEDRLANIIHEFERGRNVCGVSPAIQAAVYIYVFGQRCVSINPELLLIAGTLQLAIIVE